MKEKMFLDNFGCRTIQMFKEDGTETTHSYDKNIAGHYFSLYKKRLVAKNESNL